jgi:D-arginine dehydrogenase
VTIAADYIVIGGGIAAASLGYWLAPHGRVILLERESQPGYHATGRSAALFMESYGTPQVRSLTMASHAFLFDPPAGFSEHALVSPRGALMVAMPGQEDLLEEHWQVLASVTPHARRLDREEASALVPALRAEKVLGAIYEPDASDMDVHAIHQGYLRGVRRHGGGLVCNAEVTALTRADGLWHVRAGDTDYEAAVVCNAAGAWVDEVAALGGVVPIGIQPRRRSAFVFALPEGIDARAWPMTIGVAEDWYFKPDAGMMLGSPANADPVPPQDVQPEELDIALAIHRIEEMTTLAIRRPARTWAGCGRSSPTGTWSAASIRTSTDSSGWRRRAATASRPRRPWVRLVRHWSGACRCRRGSRLSAWTASNWVPNGCAASRPVRPLRGLQAPALPWRRSPGRLPAPRRDSRLRPDLLPNRLSTRTSPCASSAALWPPKPTPSGPCPLDSSLSASVATSLRERIRTKCSSSPRPSGPLGSAARNSAGTSSKEWWRQRSPAASPPATPT